MVQAIEPTESGQASRSISAASEPRPRIWRRSGPPMWPERRTGQVFAECTAYRNFRFIETGLLKKGAGRVIRLSDYLPPRSCVPRRHGDGAGNVRPCLSGPDDKGSRLGQYAVDDRHPREARATDRRLRCARPGIDPCAVKAALGLALDRYRRLPDVCSGQREFHESRPGDGVTLLRLAEGCGAILHSEAHRWNAPSRR